MRNPRFMSRVVHVLLLWAHVWAYMYNSPSSEIQRTETNAVFFLHPRKPDLNSAARVQVHRTSRICLVCGSSLRNRWCLRTRLLSFCRFAATKRDSQPRTKFGASAGVLSALMCGTHPRPWFWFSPRWRVPWTEMRVWLRLADLSRTKVGIFFGVSAVGNGIQNDYLSRMVTP